MSKTTAFCPTCGYLTNHTLGRKCPLCNRGTLEARPTPDSEAAPARETTCGMGGLKTCVRCRALFTPRVAFQSHCSDACFEADSSPID